MIVSGLTFTYLENRTESPIYLCAADNYKTSTAFRLNPGQSITYSSEVTSNLVTSDADGYINTGNNSRMLQFKTKGYTIGLVIQKPKVMVF